MSADYLNLVWPLSFILVMLVAIRQIRDDAGPVVKAVVTGLSQNAARNATQYAIAIGFGLSASLSAFYDVFHGLDSTTLQSLNVLQLISLCAKVLNPFVVAVLAYATQSNFRPPVSSGTTATPFQRTTP